MKVLVMGGTRMMGEAAVRHLLAAGHEITVFNRGTRRPAWAEQVDWLVGDRDVEADLTQVRARPLDVVVDFSAYRGAQSVALGGVLPDGAHLVHCSTGAVYDPVPQLPWDEGSALGPWPLFGDYAREKLAAERAVADVAEAGHAVTVFRLPYVLAPRNYAPREEFVLNRLLDDATIAVPGDGRAVLQFVTADQVGESVARMVERRPAAGLERYNVADPRGLTTLAGFVTLCAAVAGVTARTRSVPPSTGPFDAVDCAFPFPNEAYILDLEHARTAGLLPGHRPLAAAISEALEVLQAEPDRRRWTRTPTERAVLGDAA